MFTLVRNIGRPDELVINLTHQSMLQSSLIMAQP